MIGLVCSVMLLVVSVLLYGVLRYGSSILLLSVGLGGC